MNTTTLLHPTLDGRGDLQGAHNDQEAAITAAIETGHTATAHLRRMAAGGPAFLDGITDEERFRYIAALDEVSCWFSRAVIALMDYGYDKRAAVPAAEYPKAYVP